MTTIATLADSVEADFIPFYDQFMPSLKYIMVNSTSKEYRLLRGKTIECISLTGLAVGQEKVIYAPVLNYTHGLLVLFCSLFFLCVFVVTGFFHHIRRHFREVKI